MLYNYKVITVPKYQPLNNDAKLERAVHYKHSNILEHSPTVSISKPLNSWHSITPYNEHFFALSTVHKQYWLTSI